MATAPKTTKALHAVPPDMWSMFRVSPDVKVLWDGLTPLAQNEWICWVTIVKKAETRKEHLARMAEQLREGKRRPCCWPGCPHRRASAKKWFVRT